MRGNKLGSYEVWGNPDGMREAIQKSHDARDLIEGLQEAWNTNARVVSIVDRQRDGGLLQNLPYTKATALAVDDVDTMLKCLIEDLRREYLSDALCDALEVVKSAATGMAALTDEMSFLNDLERRLLDNISRISMERDDAMAIAPKMRRKG